MELKKYYRSLTSPEKAEFAKKIGYSPDYIRVHLIPANKKPDSTPPLKRLINLAENTGGNVSFSEVVKHFNRVSTVDDKAA